MNGAGRIEPVLDTLMIEPPPSATIRGPTRAREPERPLQVEPDHLVPHGFGHLAQVAVEQGHPGVVDQDVDPAEVLVGPGRPVRPARPSG